MQSDRQPRQAIATSQPAAGPGPHQHYVPSQVLARGLPVRLWIVEFFPHNSGLLSTSKGKSPEYLIEHLEHANAKKWNLLKGFPILRQPANKTHSKYTNYANYANYADTYTRIETFNKRRPRLHSWAPVPER